MTTSNWFRHPLALLGVATLTFAACGGSDSGSGDGPQGELADAAIELISGFADDEGIEVDEGCIRDIIGDLSDAEAEAGLEALQNPDSDSEAFDATGEQIEDDCFSPA